VKNKKNISGIVYSTDPNYLLKSEESEINVVLTPEQQQLKVRLETKHRAGKAVTLIEGFQGTDSEREMLVKKLKNYCGTGGSHKDNELLIQGDQREKVLQWLHKNGYQKAKKI
jgi:translation initiation factor 1